MKKCLAIHDWLTDCRIREMIDTKTEKHYFVATIRGWKGFYFTDKSSNELCREIKAIRNKIDIDDPDIFNDKKYFKEVIK